MSVSRAGLLVVLCAAAAYANSLGNGFAYDDEDIISDNPVVAGGHWVDALRLPWWPYHREGTGLYRPLTSGALAVQWDVFDGNPLGFHATNLVLHVAVSLLVFLLLAELGPVRGALVGGGLFAVHPVHTEAVANVVGQAELLSALFYLAACLLYLRGAGWNGGLRPVRVVGIGLLYFLSLSSKEIGVTLPGTLLLLEMCGPKGSGEGRAGLPTRVRDETWVWIFLGLALCSYLGFRFLVLGSVTGERVAPIFQTVSPGARVLTAIALWPQYLRLLLLPLDLASDYDPGVLFPSESVDVGVMAGLLCLLGLGALVVKSRRKAPLVSLGVLWFVVSVLPVSNLLFPTGMMLAERTLYLPSVGVALVAAGLTVLAVSLGPLARRGLLAVTAVLFVGFFVRTVYRNPAWASTTVVTRTLAREHPESWRSFRARAQDLERLGDQEGAAEAWDRAVRLAPNDYTLLVQAGEFHGREGDGPKGDGYLRRAIELEPTLANAYQILAGNLLRRGLGREAHRTAVDGLARAGSDQRLWALVSESYLLRGDLPAAVRAREAAIAADRSLAAQWVRLAEILAAMGEGVLADSARATAARLKEAGGPPSERKGGGEVP